MDCIVAVAGTIGNAAAAALAGFGVEPNELPFAPLRIRRLIEEAKTRLSTG